MIKQELDALREIGFDGFDTKEEIIEAALSDCELSLRESYDMIYKLRHQHHKSEKALKNISISLTILKLMKERSYYV